jgi:nucleoside-diphosphate-sugar epimerase
VCLRYFNVYGVNQRYDGYGNAIPIFVHRLLAGLHPDHFLRPGVEWLYRVAQEPRFLKAGSIT